MINPLVTVIIPAKNRVRLVKKAIRSVLNQSPSESIEIILVDDGSKPALNTQLGSLVHKIKLIRHLRPKGTSATRNSGLNIATGKYIAFLDSDDQWHKNFLTTSLKTLKKQHHSVGTLSLSQKIYSSKINPTQKIKLILFNFLKDFILMFSYIFNNKNLPKSAPFLSQVSHMLFTRKELNKLNFNTHMDYCEDWEFVANILRTHQITIVPQRLLRFNYSATSLSFTKKAVEKNKYYKKQIESLKQLYPISPYVTLFQIYTKYFLIGKK